MGITPPVQAKVGNTQNNIQRVGGEKGGRKVGLAKTGLSYPTKSERMRAVNDRKRSRNSMIGCSQGPSPIGHKLHQGYYNAYCCAMYVRAPA